MLVCVIAIKQYENILINWLMVHCYFLVAYIVKNVASKERLLCGVSCKSANISLCYKWVTRTAQQVVPRFPRCIVLVPKNPWTTPLKLKFTNWSTRGTCKEPSSRRALLKRLGYAVNFR